MPYFLIAMTVFVALWLLWNTVAPERLRFDPYAFIFLTLMLSLQASYAAPLILAALVAACHGSTATHSSRPCARGRSSSHRAQPPDRTRCPTRARAIADGRR